MTGTIVHTLIKVDLAIDDRWAVGTWGEADAAVQLPVLSDPRTPGRPYLPATGLAGSLRRHLGPDLARRWLGPEPGDYGDRTGTLERGGPGGLLLLGCLPVEATLSHRGATAVDLRRGAAKGTSSRTENWVEPVTVTLVAHHPGVRDTTLMRALANWAPTIGRARTSGLGRAHVASVTSIELDLGNPEHLFWWLTQRDGWLRGDRLPRGVAARVEARVAVPEAASLTWKLTAAEPIHVGVEKTGEKQFDGRKASPTMRSREVLVIPGSSWKGVFRHRVEVVLTAVGASESEREAVVAVLFGAEGRRGRLEFRDSVTTASVADPRTHVAIDRFTGGARDSALHRLLAIPEKTAIPLEVGHPAPVPDAVRNLLEHVVDDLHDGLVTVGGHGTRGYGWVRRADGSVSLAPVVVSDLLEACGVAVGTSEGGAA